MERGHRAALMRPPAGPLSLKPGREGVAPPSRPKVSLEVLKTCLDSVRSRTVWRSMPSKRAVLQQIKRDKLLAAVDRFGLEVHDRGEPQLRSRALAHGGRDLG